MTRNDPRLDLCGKHSREVYNYFVPHKIARTKKTYTDASYANRRKQHEKMWDERKKRVLPLLTKEGQASKDFQKAAKMNHHVLIATLGRLKKDGKVKREGWSGSARWSLA